jgi:DNA-binding protein YbaB
MTDPFGSPDQVRARIAEQVAAADARTAAIDRLAAEVRAAGATVRSPRGEVEVTASASAVVTDVRIADEALDLAPEELSRLVTDTVARAQAAASERALLLAADELGEDSAIVQELRSDLASRTPPTGPSW